jgi:hypothetical protein
MNIIVHLILSFQLLETQAPGTLGNDTEIWMLNSLTKLWKIISKVQWQAVLDLVNYTVKVLI